MCKDLWTWQKAHPKGYEGVWKAAELNFIYYVIIKLYTFRYTLAYAYYRIDRDCFWRDGMARDENHSLTRRVHTWTCFFLFLISITSFFRVSVFLEFSIARSVAPHYQNIIVKCWCTLSKFCRHWVCCQQSRRITAWSDLEDHWAALGASTDTMKRMKAHILTRTAMSWLLGASFTAVTYVCPVSGDLCRSSNLLIELKSWGRGYWASMILYIYDAPSPARDQLLPQVHYAVRYSAWVLRIRLNHIFDCRFSLHRWYTSWSCTRDGSSLWSRYRTRPPGIWTHHLTQFVDSVLMS